MDYILLRYGEIFLKGGNYLQFENKLIDNIKKITSIKKIKVIRGRIILPYFTEHNLLKRVFGLVSYSPAIKVDKDFETIKQKALELVKDWKGTFKIEPKRSDKRFPLTSPEINIALGKFIEENTKLKFEGKSPDHLLGLEINQDGAYLFTSLIECFGGIPTGSEGKVGVLLEDETSYLAGLLFMKRGCLIYPFAFKEKDLLLLQQFSPVPLKLHLVKDLKAIENVCSVERLNVLVSGQNYDRLKEYKTNLLVLRPLIAFKEEEIERLLNGFKDN